MHILEQHILITACSKYRLKHMVVIIQEKNKYK